MRKSEIFIIFIIILTFVIGAYFYTLVPNMVATHWNINNEVDGYMTKGWGVFFIPIVLAVLAILFIVIPRLKPSNISIQTFRKYFDWFIIVFFLFLFSIYLQTLLWNIGYKIGFNVTLPVGISILFYVCGILVEHSKQNYFIGIRTPWTLSNNIVWDKTHKLGGILFKVSGLISLLGIFFPRYSFFFILIPIMSISIFLIIYSYILYRKLLK